jgi:hypothetical protein
MIRLLRFNHCYGYVCVAGSVVSMTVSVVNKGNIRLRQPTLMLPGQEQAVDIQSSCIIQATTEPATAQPWQQGVDIDVRQEVLCQVSHKLTNEDLMFGTQHPSGAVVLVMSASLNTTCGQMPGPFFFGPVYTSLLVAAVANAEVAVVKGSVNKSSCSVPQYVAGGCRLWFFCWCFLFAFPCVFRCCFPAVPALQSSH